jgi:glutathione synthase/RimK-type ligase-like ATP-grasp enzyme
MLVGIYKSDFPEFQIKRNEIYKKILQYNNIPFIKLDLNDRDFWDKIKMLDLFIFRWAHIDDHHQIAKTILPIIENDLKIKCFPNLDTCWHFDDKIKEYYLLHTYGYPITKSCIFWDKANAFSWSKTTEYPVVFKLKKGAASSNVVLIRNYNEARKVIKKVFGKGVFPREVWHKGKVKYKNFEEFLRIKYSQYVTNKIFGIKPYTWEIEKNYALFQKFLPGNQYDTRIVTIGDRTFGFKRLVRDKDFRASGSGKIDFDTSKIDIRMVKIAQSISKELNFQSMAYDFLLNEEVQPEICEISYTTIDRVVYKCPGYWDAHLNWKDGHFVTQQLQLNDLLGLDNLKVPENLILES